METLEGFRKNLALYEGNVSCMYLDAKRLVTVGIGHLTTKAMLASLTFVHKEDTNKIATLDEKNAEYDRINASTTPKYITGGKNEWYKENITLILKEDTVNSIFDKDLAEKERDLKLVHPDLYTYPAGVRFAMLDMIFNLGTGGFRKFRSFNKAISARTFEIAVGHSHRISPVSEARNQYVKRLLMVGAQEENLNPKQPSDAEVAAQIKPLPKAKAKPGNVGHTHHNSHRTLRPGGQAVITQHRSPQGTAPAGGTQPPKPYPIAPSGHGVNTQRTGHRR